MQPARPPAVPWARFATAAFAVLAAAGGAAAAPPFGLLSRVNEGETNSFEWECPFSLLRWLIFAVLVVFAWFAAFKLMMMSSLALSNPRPPRPRVAFANAAGWFVMFVALAFVVVFAVLANDLYRKQWVRWSPAPITGLNFHILWIGVLVLGLVLMLVVRSVLRR